MNELTVRHDDLGSSATALLLGSDRTHATPELLKRSFGLSLTRAGRLAERLVGLGVLGPREPAGYPIRRGEAASQPQERDACTRRPGADEPGNPGGPATPSTPADDGDPRTRMLALDDITVDVLVQSREALNEQQVEAYSDLMEQGAAFPPVVVLEEGQTLRLADGFHRVAAARRAKVGAVEARVHRGTLRDAILHALRANLTHGLPLTRAEKRAAALRLLADAEWSRWSDQEIGRQCGLTGMTIGRLRDRGADPPHLNNVKDTRRKYRARDGRVRAMTVSSLGRRSRRSAATAAGLESSKPRATTVAQAAAPDLAAKCPAADHLLGSLEALLGMEDPVAELRGAGTGVTRRLQQRLNAVLEIVSKAVAAVTLHDDCGTTTARPAA